MVLARACFVKPTSLSHMDPPGCDFETYLSTYNFRYINGTVFAAFLACVAPQPRPQPWDRRYHLVPMTCHGFPCSFPFSPVLLPAPLSRVSLG